MKAIELRDELDEIFSENKEYENYDVFTGVVECNGKFADSIDSLHINADSKFGKIIELI